MNTSKKWIEHFTANLTEQRIDWNVKPSITPQQLQQILPSLQAWQLGETSDGSNLLCAATKYAGAIYEPEYVTAVQLFIKEEQKHGNNLGYYLDLIGKPRIQRNWGDSLFRKVRHLNTSMEWWTLAVIVVESTAQIFYQSLRDASDCKLLKAICTDILIDEAYHIDFQMERMKIIFDNKRLQQRTARKAFYKMFFFVVGLTVWMAHKKAFKAGGNTFTKYMSKMKFKYAKTLHRLESGVASYLKAHVTESEMDNASIFRINRTLN